MRKVCMRLIRFYQQAISPRKGGGCCRFIPTCSEYAYKAFEKYGFFKGFYLAVRRVLRCHPLCKGGYDPLP